MEIIKTLLLISQMSDTDSYQSRCANRILRINTHTGEVDLIGACLNLAEVVQSVLCQFLAFTPVSSGLDFATSLWCLLNSKECYADG